MNSDSNINSDENSWATLTLEVNAAPGSTSEDQIADIEDRLDNLAGLLAEEVDVAGVETRDSTTCELSPLCQPHQNETELAQPPESAAPYSQYLPPLPLGGKSLAIIVYTAPHALGKIEDLALQLAESMNLDLCARQTIHNDENWRDNWKHYYRPISVARGQLVIRPTWIETNDLGQSLELVLDPGRAFGTGLHETTRLCLDMIGYQLEENSSSSAFNILDLGCGSGILGLAYAKLFEKSIEHCELVDVDSDAVEASKENILANRLELKVTAKSGTIDDFAYDSYDLIFANIRSETLIYLATSIGERLRVGGFVYLSGILNEEVNEVKSAYTNAGFDWIASQTMADWSALKMSKVRR